MEVASSVSCSSSSTAVIRVLGVDEPASGLSPVLQQQLHPLESAASMGEHAGRIGERGVELADRSRRHGFCPPRLRISRRAAFSNLVSPAPVGAGEVAAVAVQDHPTALRPRSWTGTASSLSPAPLARRTRAGLASGGPGRRPQRSAVPGARQGAATDPRSPQPVPGRSQRSLRGQPSDQDGRPCRQSCVEGQVLAAAGPGGSGSAGRRRTASTDQPPAVPAPATR